MSNHLNASARSGRLAAARFAALGLLLVLASCESVDEGVTDYRKAAINDASQRGQPSDISNKYRLSDKTYDDVPIAAGDTFYVSLLQAYVGPDADFRRSPSFGSHEEIVVLLRVKESNEGRTDLYRDKSLNTPENRCDDPDSPGRFAFYSDDVSRGQFLNFSNLLTLGPTEYCGGVVTIDLDEVRLLGTTEHIKEKLKELADDREGAFGPDPSKRRNWNALARNVFDLIDSDSYGTRYTLTLLPSGGVVELPYPRFEAGNYVVMRHETRNDPFEWGALKLDNNTGRLIYSSSEGERAGDPNTDRGDYRDRSYVTLQINRLRNMPEHVPERRRVHAPKYRSLDQESPRS